MRIILFSALVFFIWAISIIISYFGPSGNPWIKHLGIQIPHASSLLGYFLAIAIVWGGYFMWKQKKPYKLAFFDIFGFIIAHIAIISIVFGATHGTLAQGIVFFFSILKFGVYPLFLILLWRAIGASILRISHNWKKFPLRLTVPAEIGIGLGIFAFGLLLIGFFSAYTLPMLLIWCAILAIASFSGWKHSWILIRGESLTFNIHEDIGKIFSIHISLWLFSLVFAVSLVSVFRPIPIGWDDLGVYMNFPRIMALTGKLLSGADMFIWQLITGTGYLVGGAVQAFFVNQIGGILATGGMISIFSWLFSTPKKRQYISLAAILGIVYYLLPMTIFQQAKDMKIDPALMFVSISSIAMLFLAIRQFFPADDTSPSKRSGFALLGISGILAGIAFGMKFTSFTLIVASVTAISYAFLGFFGFVGIFFWILAIFTKAKFWEKLFVWMPEDTSHIIITLVLVGAVFLIIGYKGYYKKIRDFIIATGIFALAIFLTTLPWFIKNGAESQFLQKPSIDGILRGMDTTFTPKFSNIYSPEEILARKNSEKDAMITKDGKSLNEDMGRYLGQESGINNYIKLPFNLTFQKNQPGDFTNISFLFLAFLPAILLFLRTSNRHNKIIWISFVSIFLLFAGIFSFYPPVNIAFSRYFGSIDLPEGYAILIAFVLIFAAGAHFILDNKSEKSKDTKFFLIFGLIYGLIFWVSAFGIVWYGIAIYFFLLAILGYSLLYLNVVEPHNPEDIRSAKLFILCGFLFLFSIFFIQTFFYSWKNLHNAGHTEYKFYPMHSDFAIFYYRDKYLPIVSILNVKDPNQLAKDFIQQPSIQKVLQQPSIQKIFGNTINPQNISYHSLHSLFIYLFTQANNQSIQKNQSIQMQQFYKIFHNHESGFYSKILAPDASIANTDSIYRVGTFLPYFIYHNRSRMFHDNLLFSFENFFFDANPDVTVDRLAKTGVNYLLIDLNTPTIDRDARHALTTRHEHLLTTLRSPHLQIFATDSICLRFAIDYDRYEKFTSDEEFLQVAGVTYNSFKSSEKDPNKQQVISASTKKQHCANAIVQQIIKHPENIQKQYPYLSELLYIAQTNTQQATGKYLSDMLSGNYFALIKVSDALPPTN